MAWRSGKSMKIRLRDGLPFISASLLYQRREITLENVLLDTGSAGTLFATDAVSAVGLTYEPQDSVHRIRGVGGAEFVFTKRVDRLSVDTLHADDFEIEVARWITASTSQLGALSGWTFSSVQRRRLIWTGWKCGPLPELATGAPPARCP